MAQLFAQSILCKERIDGFACERCNVCRRIAEREYADYAWIDGSETSIKKSDIVRLQEMFVKTALEEDSHKIYVMNHVENATGDRSQFRYRVIQRFGVGDRITDTNVDDNLINIWNFHH